MSDVDQRVILVVVVLASFLTPFASSSFNIALPSIATEFGLDAVTMSWANLCLSPRLRDVHRPVWEARRHLSGDGRSSSRGT